MLTVFFSTLNGATTLPRVLDAYRHLEEPAGGWKMVVIDNGSTDDSAQILAQARQHLPLAVLSESRKGKNAALNTGLESLEGDLAVFVDDDIIPSSGWLKQLRSAADLHPEHLVFGGPLRPAWDSPPPEWILAGVPSGPAFALLEGREGEISVHSVFGGNMAVRSRVFQDGLRFNEAIGPKGTNYGMGSETDLLWRLTDSGFKGWFSEQAVVFHIIRSHQLESSWLVGRARRYGRGQYRIYDSHLNSQRWLGVPRWLVRDIVYLYSRYLVESLRLRPARAFAARWELNVALGKAAEARKSAAE